MWICVARSWDAACQLKPECIYHGVDFSRMVQYLETMNVLCKMPSVKSHLFMEGRLLTSIRRAYRLDYIVSLRLIFGAVLALSQLESLR